MGNNSSSDSSNDNSNDNTSDYDKYVQQAATLNYIEKHPEQFDNDTAYYSRKDDVDNKSQPDIDNKSQPDIDNKSKNDKVFDDLKKEIETTGGLLKNMDTKDTTANLSPDKNEVGIVIYDNKDSSLSISVGHDANRGSVYVATTHTISKDSDDNKINASTFSENMGNTSVNVDKDGNVSTTIETNVTQSGRVTTVQTITTSQDSIETKTEKHVSDTDLAAGIAVGIIAATPAAVPAAVVLLGAIVEDEHK